MCNWAVVAGCDVGAHAATQYGYCLLQAFGGRRFAFPPYRAVQQSQCGLPELFTYRSGLAAARELLKQKKRPTAVFASNDNMAAAVIAVAHGMHLAVPEDLAVAGFDDTPVATTVWPELTTIHQPIGDMARAAVDLVVEQIRRRRAGEPKFVQHKLLPYTLVVRDSTKAISA